MFAEALTELELMPAPIEILKLPPEICKEVAPRRY